MLESNPGKHPPKGCNKGSGVFFHPSYINYLLGPRVFNNNTKKYFFWKAGNDDNLRNNRATAKYYTSKESSSKNLSFGAGYTLLSHWVPELRPYLSPQSIQISLQSRNLHLSHNLAPFDVYIYRKNVLSPNGIHPKNRIFYCMMCDDLLLQARYFAPHYFLRTMNSGPTFRPHLL